MAKGPEGTLIIKGMVQRPWNNKEWHTKTNKVCWYTLTKINGTKANNVNGTKTNYCGNSTMTNNVNGMTTNNINGTKTNHINGNLLGVTGSDQP